MDVTGLADPYVKIYLLYNVSESDKSLIKIANIIFMPSGTTNCKEKDAREETNFEPSVQRKFCV
jgi:hypothetical protein